MKQLLLNLLTTLIITTLIYRGIAGGQICDDWKSQSTAYVVTGSTPEDPDFYAWEEKTNIKQGAHLCVLNADVIPVYIQQGNNYINFTTRFGPSTALLYMLQLEVSIDGNAYSTIYSGSAKQDVVWFNSSSAFPQLGNYELKVRVTFFDGTIRYREYEIKVIPPSQKLFKDNAGNTLRKWAGNDPYGKNAIVFSEGFDAYNTNGQEMYYHAAAQLIQCFNDHGYDVFLLDNYFGTQDIRNNAAIFSSAVSFISDLYDDEFIVAGGVSMGGIISRFALALAEENNDPLPVHTFIAIDSPHQGAIVSEPLQNFKKDNEGDDEFAKYALSNIAARQLLCYNAYDQEGTDHDAFYQQLNTLNGDGYPHLTRNIGVSFSTDEANPNTGGWYKITYHTGPINGTIKTFDLTNAEKQSGSWLPKDLTSMSPIIKQASYWWLQLLVPGITPLYYPTIEFERFSDPTYITYESAMDIRGNHSMFDVCIEPQSTSWHDVLPQDIVESIVNEVILTDLYYQDKDLYTPWLLRGRKVAIGNYVTTLYPRGDVVVHPSGQLSVMASDRIMLQNGFSVKYGARAYLRADPTLYYECTLKSDRSNPGRSLNGSHANHALNTAVITNNKLADGLDFTLYPNPVHDQVKLFFGDPQINRIKVEIFNTQGIRVFSGDDYPRGTVDLNVEKLNSGYYIVRVSEGRRTADRPLIKL